MGRTTAMKVENLELVLDAHAVLGEGPMWDAQEGALFWVDIVQGLVHRYDPSTGKDQTFDIGQPVGAVRPRASGGLVLAVRDGFGFLDTATGRWELIAEVEADNPGNRMNDGSCDSAGRFWAGTMAFDDTPGAGSLYRFETDHRVVRIFGDVTISNGIGWSPDDTTMYYIDTGLKRLDVFDHDPESGAIANRRPLIEFSDSSPDGMTIDAEGFIWIALWEGWSVRRFAPDGRLDRVVELPVSAVTSCAFGGPDLSDLYITTASRDLTPEGHQEQPHAGGLFRCRPGVRGMPAYSYRG